MHTFKIVGAQCGWAIQLGDAMTIPCKSQSTAIEQAERMAAALRRHGEAVSVMVELSDINDLGLADSEASPPSKKSAMAARTTAPRRLLRTK